jgi:hypothetical protein
MTEKRKQEITDEVKRRVNLWLTNTDWNEMTCYGSYIRFNMSVGMRGYPFEKEEWMNKNDFKNFITDKEDESDFFNELMTDMFYHSQKQKPIK